jgi:predicted permease
MRTLINLFNNIGLSTFISSVFLIIDINFERLSYCIILFAINKDVIPLLNSESTVSAFIPPVYYIYNFSSSKSERLRSFSLGEKRVSYKPRSKYNAHFNVPR